MGWGNCGTDSRGRSIGYIFEATCDHPGCEVKIHRGLSYACGGMHGEDEVSCEKYFCEKHRLNFIKHSRSIVLICDECYKTLLDSEEWVEDEDEGLLIQKIGG